MRRAKRKRDDYGDDNNNKMCVITTISRADGRRCTADAALARGNEKQREKDEEKGKIKKPLAATAASAVARKLNRTLDIIFGAPPTVPLPSTPSSSH